MEQNIGFYVVLDKFMQRDGRTPGQLSRKSGELFGAAYKIPRETITRWRNGNVERPRHWQDIVRLAIALRLSQTETDELLTSAGHSQLVTLQTEVRKETDQELLVHWQNISHPTRKDDVTPVSSSYPPFQAPPNLPFFIGRATELKKLKAVFRQEGQNRICCLWGMGGIGKSSLAIHAAYELQDTFPDGVLWAKLDQSDNMAILHNFAASYGVDVGQLYPDISNRSSKVRELLAHKQVLIILDNVATDTEIRPLLPPNGACGVIITTRRHDLTLADQAYRLHIKPFAVSSGESLALFAKILGGSWVRREQMLLEKIAACLGHLPMAINIAANRLKHELGWSTADFLTQLEQAQDNLLEELIRGDQNIRLSFDLSYSLLTLEQQAFFASLALFAGEDFSAQAASGVTAVPITHTRRNLRQLHSLSFIQPGRSGRYQLHPLLRQYGREKLKESIPYERLVSYFVEFVEGSQEQFMELDRDYVNITNALQIASDKKMQSYLIRGVIAFSPYLKTRGLYDQAYVHLLAAQQAAELQRDYMAQSMIHSFLGDIAQRKAQPHIAVTHYQHGIDLLQELTTIQALAHKSRLFTSLGALMHRNARFEQADKNYIQAMNIAKDLADEDRIVTVQINQGLLAAVQGNPGQAQTIYLNALQSARELKNKSRLIIILQNFGVLLNEQGNHKQAREYFSEGLEIAQALGNLELQCSMIGNLGNVAHTTHNYHEALAYFRQAFTIAEKMGHEHQISRQQANLGMAEGDLDHNRKAELHFQEALALAKKGNYIEDVCHVLNLWGETKFKQLFLADANQMFQEVHDIAEKANLQKYYAQSLYGLARIAALRGNMEKAKRLGQQSRTIFLALAHRHAQEIYYWLQELPEGK